MCFLVLSGLEVEPILTYTWRKALDAISLPLHGKQFAPNSQLM
jgi:hypothetical protein